MTAGRHLTRKGNTVAELIAVGALHSSETVAR
jgi:hypothetical protein